jgi:hypothetical protein
MSQPNNHPMAESERWFVYTNPEQVCKFLNRQLEPHGLVASIQADALPGDVCAIRIESCIKRRDRRGTTAWEAERLAEEDRLESIIASRDAQIERLYAVLEDKNAQLAALSTTTFS